MFSVHFGTKTGRYNRILMLQTIELKPKAARRLVLDSQGLAREASFGRGKKAVAEAIHQLGYVQIDTISVIQRAHHHVLNTRIPGYQESMLHTLQAVDNSVFEYWSHAAAYLPIRDFRYYLPIMQGFAANRPRDKKLVDEILKRIHTEGALQARISSNHQVKSPTVGGTGNPQSICWKLFFSLENSW
jgi:uncharacterized protein YcaQ